MLDPFPQLIFTPPQEGRLVGSDFFAVNLVGRMKGITFFSSFGYKKVSYSSCQFADCASPTKTFVFFWTYDLWGKQS